MLDTQQLQMVGLGSVGRMAFMEAGTEHNDHPPVLLVHGSLCDYRYWEPQMDALAAHRHVIAVSLPHYYPMADQPAGLGFSIQTHVDALLSLIHDQQWGPVDLLGHSRGGCVAFHLASQDPSVLNKLLLADPGGSLAVPDAEGNIPAPLKSAYAPTDPRMLAAGLIASGNVEEGLRIFIDTVSRAGFWDRSTETFQTMARDNSQTLSMQIRDVLPLYTKSAARMVTVPTLLLNGDKSAPSFVNTSKTLDSWMPYAQRAIIKGASHGMNLSHASEFNRLVLQFVGA